jgi:hypothetical protein
MALPDTLRERIELWQGSRIFPCVQLAVYRRKLIAVLMGQNIVPRRRSAYGDHAGG